MSKILGDGMTEQHEKVKGSGKDVAGSMIPEAHYVLAVDDDPDVLALTSRMLEAMGYRVDTAVGGLEAILCIRRNRYNIVISDFQMPEMDGLTLASWIKRRAKQIKVVIMTGQSPETIKAHKNTHVADGWIFKPFGQGDLCQTLQSIRSVAVQLLPPDEAEKRNLNNLLSA